MLGTFGWPQRGKGAEVAEIESEIESEMDSVLCSLCLSAPLRQRRRLLRLSSVLALSVSSRTAKAHRPNMPGWCSTLF